MNDCQNFVDAMVESSKKKYKQPKPKICDVDAMLSALDKGILAGVAHDSGGIQVGDISDPFYQKLLKNPKVIVTPHIAYKTDATARRQYDMMIDNVEAWIKGHPVNLVK